MTVGEKLRAAFSADEAMSNAFLETGHSRPQTGNGHLGEFEMDCLDWGLAYGMAFALCREASPPWESHASVAQRAFHEAWSLWSDWSGGFHERSIDDKVQAVVAAYQATGGLPRGLESFEDALIGLSNAAGDAKP